MCFKGVLGLPRVCKWVVLEMCVCVSYPYLTFCTCHSPSLMIFVSVSAFIGFLIYAETPAYTTPEA